MLSVGSRDDGSKGLLGFGAVGGEMEENELEEGEACSGPEDDATIDPDTDLSYIDEKIQNILGHLQKDFEGGVCAENLGAKFGGYGSFLPAYQRSPSILSHTKSPQKIVNSSTKSPYNPPFEKTDAPTSAPTLHGNSTSALTANKHNSFSVEPPFINSGKNDLCGSVPNAWGSTSPDDLINKQPNCDRKSLKLCVRVGSDNTFARNNAAIYSGLGLDFSPSPSPSPSPSLSMGDSPGVDLVCSPEFSGMRDDSPITTYQFYTCIRVPSLGTCLLSPLPNNLLRMMDKEKQYKDLNVSDRMVGHGISALSSEEMVPGKIFKHPLGKNKISVERKSRSAEVKNFNSKNGESDIGASILKKQTDIETSSDADVVSDAVNIPLLSGSMSNGNEEHQMHADMIKGSSAPRRPDKFMGKGITLSNILANDWQLDDLTSVGLDKLSSSGNEFMQPKGKLCLKAADKPLVEKKTDILKGEKLADEKREGKGAIDKDSDIEKCGIEGFKDKKDNLIDPAEFFKLKTPQRVISIGQNEGKKMQGKEVSGGKRKAKEGQSNDTSTGGSLKENYKSVASTTAKEKKKSSHSKGEISDSKSNALKSRKDSNKIHNSECQWNDSVSLKVDHTDTRFDTSEIYPREKTKDHKLEYDDTKCFEKIEVPRKKKTDTSSAQAVDKMPEATTSTVNGSTSVDKVLEATTSAVNGVALDVASQQPATVIKEHWVCCDRCQKWRLLPYGTNPDHLPKKWLCSMLTWLPGMNRCNFSEEETTKALHALYQLPVPEGSLGGNAHRDAPYSSLTHAESQNFHPNHDSFHHDVPGVAKRRPTMKDASNLPGFVQITNSAKDNNQTSVRSKSLSDVNKSTLETNHLIKSGSQHTSKSTDFIPEKQKSKPKEKQGSYERLSDGGNSIDKNGKQTKAKIKTDIDQDAMRSSKKLKTRYSETASKNYQYNIDLEEKSALDTVNGSSSKVTGKNFVLQAFTSKFESKDTSPVSGKKSKASIVKITGNGEAKEYVSPLDTEKSDSIKKRKVKDRQDNQIDIREETNGAELKKEKKARVLKTEGSELGVNMADDKREKHSTKILLSRSRERMSNGNEDDGAFMDKEHQLDQTNMDSSDLMKREPGYTQPSTAATSSSSKVSGSHKSKTNIQETRGSPVESVSSSPLRISYADKVTTRNNLMRKDDAMNARYSITGSPKRCSDGEVVGSCDQVRANQKGKTRAAGSTVMDPMRGRHDLESRGNGLLPPAKDKDILFSKIFGGMDDEPSPSDYEEIDGGADIAVTSEEANKHDDLLRGKGHSTVKERADNSCNVNVPNGRRNSGKSSSSRSSERHRTYNIDITKDKRKVSDSYSDKNGHFIANDVNNCFDYDATIGSRGRSIYDGPRNIKPSIPEKKEQINYAVKSGNKFPNDDKRDENHSACMQEKEDFHGSLPVGKQSNARVGDVSIVSGNGCKLDRRDKGINMAAFWEDDKLSNQFQLDRTDKVEAGVRIKFEPVEPSGEKSNTQNRGLSRAVPMSVIKGKSEATASEAATGDADKIFKHHSQKLENQNGSYRGNSRNDTPNRVDGSGTLKKEAAASVLKEARDLKHTANRLKGEGLEKESTGLYFEAALKFLHVALLLENSNSENGKHGDMTSAIQMYSDTAKLCEFCAHEYEKSKEMAHAALAYKCMEVAYMKVVYFKHSNASKDRHELQIAPQMSIHGESPSSSASDIDNLNNHGLLDKAPAIKGSYSAQVAGNHVIPARSRPNFMRLLGFAEDVNYAMDASRKSLNAFTSATVTLEAAHGVDGIMSVKRVFDFSFHDVEGLLRLVRLSMELISQ